MKIRFTLDERWPTIYEVHQMGEEHEVEDQVVERWRRAQQEYNAAETALLKATGYDRYID